LLLWGQTEGNPGITPLFNFGYGADRLLTGFSFKIKIRFFNQVLQPGRTQQQSPTAASLPRWLQVSSTLCNLYEQLQKTHSISTTNIFWM